MKDLLIIDPSGGNVFFSAGSGSLVTHADKSSRVVQALSLFARHVINEPIQFVRFQSHRMIFLPGSELIAVSLVSVEVNPRQIIPIIRLTLWLVESYADYLGIGSNYNQMVAFYQALSDPSSVAFVFPRTPEGLLDLLTLVTILVHDLRYGINDVISNLYFVNSVSEIPKIVENVRPRVIFAFFPESDQFKELGIPYCCVSQDNPEESIFHVSREEKSFKKISSLFGALGYKYGDYVAKILDTEDAMLLAKEVMSLPKTKDDVLYRAITEAAINPRKDILTTLTQVVVETLEELRAEQSVTEELKPITFDETEVSTASSSESLSSPVTTTASTSDQSGELQLPDLSSLEETTPPSSTEIVSPPPASTTEPSALPAATPPSPVAPKEIVGKLSDEQLTKLRRAISEGWLYKLETVPLIVDFSPYHSGVSPPPGYKDPYLKDKDKLILQVLPPESGKITVRFYLPEQRIRAALSSMDSLAEGHDAQLTAEQDHITITVPAEKFTFAIRAIIWSAVVEYLDEVSYGVKERNDTFRFPNEGTIMLIPPKRDFVKEKLPKKIAKIVYQDAMHQQHETKDFWTVARAIDVTIKELTEPLHQGKGVAFKLQDDSLEEEQITLFLLVVSELTGVGWSRW